jgi:hypothetical protein
MRESLYQRALFDAGPYTAWKQDEDATPETHPGIPYHPPRELRRF